MSVSPVVERANAHVAIPTRRGWLERAKRYITGEDLDEAENAGRASMLRLPDPLPSNVRAVAIGHLLAGVGGVLGALLVKPVMAAFAVWRSLDGSGVSPIVGALVSTAIGSIIGAVVPFFLARGSARLLRRDPRGLHTLRMMAQFALVCASIGTVMLTVMYLAGSKKLDDLTGPVAMLRVALSLGTTLAFEIWSVRVLRRYRDEVAAENPLVLE